MASSPLTKQVQKAIEGGADQGKIIERLLLKIDHMTKKTERSSFALVLIDGDGMIVSMSQLGWPNRRQLT